MTLSKNNYLLIKDFITSDRAEVLLKEFSQYCDDNDLTGDDQVTCSQVCYNYLSFLELLVERTGLVSEKIGETVLPTYSYARMYYRDAVLNSHTDRPACEVSVTLHLGGDQPWDFWIEDNEGKFNNILLQPGQALIYNGMIARHYRTGYTGDNYGQVFLHYVRSRGKYSKHYFDNNR